MGKIFLQHLGSGSYQNGSRVTATDLGGEIIWDKEIAGTMDTYLDTNEKKRLTNMANPLDLLAGATGIEPATSGVTGRRSNRLNYAPDYLFKIHYKKYPKSNLATFPSHPRGALTG